MAMNLLAPLWWLWYVAAYIYSHSWALGGLIAAISSVYLLYRSLEGDTVQAASRPKAARVVTKPATLVREVKQVLPVHPHNGWSLCSVSHGLRVFSRFFPSLGVSNTPCLAATTLVHTSSKKLLFLATNGRDIPCWLAGVSMVPQYIQQAQGTLHNDADIIQLSFQRHTLSQLTMLQRVLGILRRKGTTFTQKYATFLDGVFTIPTNYVSETLEREWQIDGEGRGHMCWVARQPSQLPYYWSVLTFSASTKEKGVSIATLIMLPKSPDSQLLTSDLLTSQLISLRDFLHLRRARVYSTSSSSSSSSSSSPILPARHPHKGHVTSVPDEVFSVPRVPDLQEHSGRSSGKESPVMPQHLDKKPVKRAKRDSQNLVPNGSLLTTLSFPDGASSHVQEQHNLTSTSIADTPPLLTTHTPSQPSPLPTNTPSPPTSPLESRYTKLGKESCDTLVQASRATEQDGWIAVGIQKDVVVMKLPPKRGEASVNCIKGTGIINAPPEFVYRIVRNTENNVKLDDMLKETRVIDRITDTTVVVHLIFKAVWPTSPRDFTLISTAGRYNETTLVEAGVSVVDPRLPEEKGYVRGNLLCGGYVIKTCPGKSDQCEVTYVSQAELKGNIPTFAVNKVSESQPQCVSRLRALAEDQYAKLKNNPQKMKEFEDAVLLSPINPRPGFTDGADLQGTDTERGTEEAREPEVTGGESGESGTLDVSDDHKVCENGENRVTERVFQRGEGEEKERRAAAALEYTNSWAVLTSPPPPPPGSVGVGTGREGDGILVMEPLEAYTPEEISSEGEGEGEGEERMEEREELEGGGDADERRREELEKTEHIRFEKKLRPYPIPSAPPATVNESLTEESITFPRQESGGVDFRTLGNQTAARVLEELFHVSSLDIANPGAFDNEASGWKVSDMEKGIVILKKKVPGNPFLSFMGKGVIKLAPRKVYDCLRNPQLRFTYDNMLKELHFVKHIEDGLYVLHIHHETTQCFIKQSRDFCILANERTEGNKLLLVGLSVDIPECPVNPNITRGKITYSGWSVEPYRVKDKTYSLITYLLQVDLGGVPSTLVNYVSKRQPLAIAYLRDYLNSTSLQISSVHT